MFNTQHSAFLSYKAPLNNIDRIRPTVSTITPKNTAATGPFSQILRAKHTAPSRVLAPTCLRSGSFGFSAACLTASAVAICVAATHSTGEQSQKDIQDTAADNDTIVKPTPPPTALRKHLTTQKLAIRHETSPTLLGSGAEAHVFSVTAKDTGAPLAAKVSKMSDTNSRLNTINEYLIRKAILEIFAEGNNNANRQSNPLTPSCRVVPAITLSETRHLFSPTLDSQPRTVFTMAEMDETLSDCGPIAQDSYFEHHRVIAREINRLESLGFEAHDVHEENILLKDNVAYISDCGLFQIRSGSRAAAAYMKVLAAQDFSDFSFDLSDEKIRHLLAERVIVPEENNKPRNRTDK